MTPCVFLKTRIEFSYIDLAWPPYLDVWIAGFVANMAVDNILEDEEENILYDLLINTEWPPETDTQVIEICLGCVSRKVA